MTDLYIIERIEKELNLNLVKLDKIGFDSKGYTLNEKGQLTGLGLYGCVIKNLNCIISHLTAFPNLTTLNLNLNQLNDISPLEALPNLTTLDLSFNQINDISPLEALSNLTTLYLSFNQINDISLLEALTNLTQLSLSGNQIRDISPLKALTNLTQLNLDSNKIGDISPLIDILKALPNLTLLNLDSNKIGDISPLKALPNLTQLSLSGNQIRDISPISTLKNLTVLNLYVNQICNISPLKDLKNLTTLHLSCNKISDISPIEGLKNLKILGLWENRIININPLKDLKNLSALYLWENPIEELPPWITDFDMSIQWESYGNDGFISFSANPLKSPPPEIVKQGKEAIKNFFNQLKEQEEDYLFEAKMLIVGEPGAGKTSMAWKMEKEDCNLPEEEDTTKGIDIKQYYFPLQKEDFKAFKHPEKLKNRKFRLNLWDFGGQEIYKATHRFFLSKRSLYALVADSRNEDTDFNYWLHIVEIFGGDSPLLIVLNEKFQRKRNLDISAMQKRFSNISQVLDIDFAEADKTRLNKLERAVKYYVSQLPHIGSPVPAKWTVVREALESDKRNTITVQDYLKICQDNGIKKTQDALVLSQYFHDIGVFLHFQEDDLLEKTIFLKPNWATHAVYKILDYSLLNQKNGRFNKEDAKTIWCEDEYEFVRDELLRLMQKFFLTYEIEHSGEYIVPEQLNAAQPDYPWDAKDNLLLRYEYELFMPKGILSQFIVQMHRYIHNHNYVWRRGVVLMRENTTAEIIETYDARAIKIRIAGKNERDFMTIITEQLDQINAQYEKMKVEKMIPCNCDECNADSNPYFYKYKDLKRRIEKGRQEVECGRSYKMVNVRSLIDEVLNEELRGYGTKDFIGEKKSCQSDKVKRDKVFVSYSHKDEEWLKRVQTHLKVLENLGITVNLWDDTKIKAGMKWCEEIEKALSASKVAILLVSTDFLASDFIRMNELPPLLKASKNEGATILSLILKPCLYIKHKELAEFEAVNDPSKPLSKLLEHEQDEILVKLAERITELINEDG